VSTETVMISPGERYDLVVDFSPFAGKNLTLANAAGISEMVDYAATDKVMRFAVGRSVSDSSNNGAVPSTLRRVPYPPKTDRVDKDFEFKRDGDEWKINGVGFADVANRILARPARGSVEVWNLRNSGDAATHPVHIHLIDFQILSRTGGRNKVLPYEAAGLKDVVYLAAGEYV
jgi:FtsP/CotA-like multicopper oxidase with cupredoxin domain